MRGILCLVSLVFIVLVGGCSDDGGTTVPDRGEIYRIPTDYSLEEAVAAAGAGDTLIFLFSPLPLDATVTIQSAQTPLVLLGNKNYPTLSAPPGVPILRFLSPRAGTRVEGLGFSGGSYSIFASGAGEISVIDCRFRLGQVQILGSGNGLTLRVEDVLSRDAAFFGIQVEARARVEATRVTVVDARDCGILITGSGRGRITSSILWRATNYGIACTLDGMLESESGCNDVFLNGVAPYLDCPEPESDFHEDPLFCDEPNGDFTLQSTSFCAPGNSGGCGQVGAFLPACEPPAPPASAGP